MFNYILMQHAKNIILVCVYFWFVFILTLAGLVDTASVKKINNLSIQQSISWF